VHDRKRKRFPGDPFELVIENKRALRFAKKRQRPTWYKLSPNADMFNDKISDEYLIEIFTMISENKEDLFQVSTKYVHRMNNFLKNILSSELHNKCDNLMVGVNIETDEYAWRTYELNAWKHSKFLQFSPLLGPVHDIDLSVIDWVVVSSHYSPLGGVTKVEWILDIIDQSRALNVPVSVDFISNGSGKNDYPHIGGQRWMGKPGIYLKWRMKNEFIWFRSKRKTRKTNRRQRLR